LITHVFAPDRARHEDSVHGRALEENTPGSPVASGPARLITERVEA
jgi:hypothetical protein